LPLGRPARLSPGRAARYARRGTSESLRRDEATFTAKVDVVEWVGNDAYAYIRFEALARAALGWTTGRILYPRVAPVDTERRDRVEQRRQR
jgi:hypothetical protein